MANPRFLGSPHRGLPGAAAQVVKSRGKQASAVLPEGESPEGDITSSCVRRSKEGLEDAVSSPWSIDMSWSGLKHILVCAKGYGCATT